MQIMMLQLTSTSAKLNLWAAVFSLFIGFHGISFFCSRVQGFHQWPVRQGTAVMWCGGSVVTTALKDLCQILIWDERLERLQWLAMICLQWDGSTGPTGTFLWHSTIFCWSFTRDYHLRPNSVDGKEDPRVLHAGVAWCGCRKDLHALWTSWDWTCVAPSAHSSRPSYSKIF
jgi:hypothetical protein